MVIMILATIIVMIPIIIISFFLICQYLFWITLIVFFVFLIKSCSALCAPADHLHALFVFAIRAHHN